MSNRRGLIHQTPKARPVAAFQEKTDRQRLRAVPGLVGQVALHPYIQRREKGGREDLEGARGASPGRQQAQQQPRKPAGDETLETCPDALRQKEE